MLFKAAFGFRSACSLCFPQSWHTSTRRHPLLLYAEELWPLLCPPAEAGCCCRTNLQSHRFQELQDVLLNSNDSLWPACCSAYHPLQFSAAALIYIHVLLVWKLWKWAGRVNVWIFPPSFKSVLNVIFLAVLNHLQVQTKVHQLKRDEQFDLMWSEVKRDETLTTTDGFNVCTLQRRCSVKCSCTFSLPVKHFVSPEMQILLVCLVSSLFSLRLRCLASVLIHKFVTFLVSPVNTLTCVAAAVTSEQLGLFWGGESDFQLRLEGRLPLHE